MTLITNWLGYLWGYNYEDIIDLQNHIKDNNDMEVGITIPLPEM